MILPARHSKNSRRLVAVQRVNSRGYFVFRELKPGSYSLVLRRKPDKAYSSSSPTEHRIRVVSNGRPQRVKFQLRPSGPTSVGPQPEPPKPQPESRSITIRVVTRPGGEFGGRPIAIPDAKVLVRLKEHPNVSGKTDRNGLVKLRIPTMKRVAVHISHLAYQPITTTLATSKLGTVTLQSKGR